MLDEGLVDRLYEAAVIPERWPDLLADLAEIAESPAGILMGFAPASPQNGKMIASPAYAEIAKQFYSGGWGANNARFAVGAQNGSAFQSRFISEEDIFPAGYPFEREGLYKDLLIPGGLGRSIRSVFSHAHGDVVILTF